MLRLSEISSQLRPRDGDGGGYNMITRQDSSNRSCPFPLKKKQPNLEQSRAFDRPPNAMIQIYAAYPFDACYLQ